MADSETLSVEEIVIKAKKIAKARKEQIDLIDQAILAVIPAKSRSDVRELMKAKDELKSSATTMDTVLKNIA